MSDTRELPDSSTAADPPGGSGTTPAIRDLSGQVLCGRYRVIRVLGSGGMGTVYLAEHLHLKRLTVVKLLRFELTRNPKAEERFRREALLAARLVHPSIAQVYDFDRTAEGESLLVMEYIEGETIGQRLRRDGSFSPPVAARILLEVAGGLDYAHNLGIVHRDIKPENIMLAAGEAAKLLDFGIARPLDSDTTLTPDGFLVGTPAYMSPEQLSGKPAGPSSDIYSLGAVFYEMLSRQRVHSGNTLADILAEVERVPAPLHILRPELPPSLSEVAARALQKDAALRWPSASEFARAAMRTISPPEGEAVGAAAPSARSVDPMKHWEAHFQSLRFAGRDREVRMVKEAWAAARAGRATLLWIEGEEGAGKSSFFDLARREAALAGASEHIGRGYEADGFRIYGSWSSILRSALKAGNVEETDRPLIQMLIHAREPAEVSDRKKFFEEVASLFRQACGRGPVLVAIDDLDWCDPASLALFEFLVHDLGDVPILFVVCSVSSRPRGTGPLPDVRERMRRLDRVVWVGLRPLGYEAVDEWLSRALEREAPDELVRFVYGHTEGNTFFIDQVVRSLLERGDLLRLSDDNLRLTLSEAPPPEAVADVIRRRLRGMSPIAREVLQIAAVVGREFDVDFVLTILTHPESSVLEALDEAVQAGILASIPRAGGDWYRFTNGKIAQALAQEMNSRRRRKLHENIAAALEGKGGAPEGEIAWHLYRAGQMERASRAALAAGREAMALHDYDDALTFGVMAAETGQEPVEKQRANELRADALARLDRHAEAAAAYAQARTAGLAEGEDEVRLRRKELREELLAGNLDPSDVLAEARKLSVRAASISVAKRAAVEVLLAEALLASGDLPAAAEAAERAHALATGAGERSRAAEALLILGKTRFGNQDATGADRAASDAGELFLQAGDPYGAAKSLLLRASTTAKGGDLAAAKHFLQDALSQADRAQAPRLLREIRGLSRELSLPLPQ